MNELMDAFRCLFELPSDPQEGSEWLIFMTNVGTRMNLFRFHINMPHCKFSFFLLVTGVLVFCLLISFCLIASPSQLPFWLYLLHGLESGFISTSLFEPPWKPPHQWRWPCQCPRGGILQGWINEYKLINGRLWVEGEWVTILFTFVLPTSAPVPGL